VTTSGIRMVCFDLGGVLIKHCRTWREGCAAAGLRLRVPRPGLCTDNGAMVAALGAELVARGRPPSSLDHAADSSMPVTQVLA